MNILSKNIPYLFNEFSIDRQLTLSNFCQCVNPCDECPYI